MIGYVAKDSTNGRGLHLQSTSTLYILYSQEANEQDILIWNLIYTCSGAQGV